MNPDTSVDVWFGPTAPKGHEGNWVQTVPGKGWNVLFRLYGPLQPWFDKTWKPGSSNWLNDTDHSCSITKIRTGERLKLGAAISSALRSSKSAEH